MNALEAELGREGRRDHIACTANCGADHKEMQKEPIDLHGQLVLKQSNSSKEDRNASNCDLLSGDEKF
jgi:hypothetical protein